MSAPVNYNTEVFPDPADVPEDIPHGGSSAYNDYHCRCRHCATWSRLHRQVNYWRDQAQRLKRRREAQDYLALKGVTLAGPGVFRDSPIELALIVAKYLGEDLEAWLNGKGRSAR